MFNLKLDDIAENHLNQLEQDAIPESIRLEFKRQLDLADRKQKAEAAKDVSAMANTAGGRILYGISEKKLRDGSTVASSIQPLVDGKLDSRLEDVLLGNIFPQPRFRTRKVPVNGGFVLIVEVYPAYSGDLYMVTGFNEKRFYRRGEQRTVLMTEPEIREAYARIAASRRALEASIEDMIASELAMVPHLWESAMVIPWYGHRDLVDVRQFGSSFSSQLAERVLRNTTWGCMCPVVSVVTDGYCGYAPQGALNQCRLYAAVRRNGLVHFAYSGSVNTASDGTFRYMYYRHLVDTIVPALLTAQYVLGQTAYWGPVRVVYRIKADKPFHFLDIGEVADHIRLRHAQPVPAGEYTHSVPEANLEQHRGTMMHVLRELLDQLFQTGGQVKCPWFDVPGALVSQAQASFRPELLRQLEK